MPRCFCSAVHVGGSFKRTADRLSYRLLLCSTCEQHARRAGTIQRPSGVSQASCGYSGLRVRVWMPRGRGALRRASALRRMLAAVGGRSALSCGAEVAVVMGVCVCSNYVAAGRIVRLCLIIRPIHGTSLYNIANSGRSGTTPRRFQGLRFLRGIAASA